ncbi:uncharacterized protein LOC131951357 isoform X2 [Physella acuta]|nr:uncharacterized protein LOC131951357 isoform X2 [Physella acuta]XP_059169718.1 uncharacterized protein LOC131951357 isoform X2 [Physella acuta]
MESRPEINDLVLDASAFLLSEEFVQQLATELEPYRLQVSQELGLPSNAALPEGLLTWKNQSGATLFVLIGILKKIRRPNCIDMIAAYMAKNTMQLYVKVDSDVEGRPHLSNRRFHEVTTWPDVTLEEALKNILSGSLRNYEIAGPGPDVTWQTKAKDIKGKQLTLLHHDQPAHEISLNTYRMMDENTHPKAFNHMNISGYNSGMIPDPTKIENLKYKDTLSVDYMAVSNSNNMIVTTPEPHSSMLPEGRSDTLTHFTDDNMEFEYTLHSQTHAKIPMFREDPNFEASGSKKFHNKKVFDSPVDQQPSNLLSQPAGNVPNFSIIINEDSHSQLCKNLEPENDMKQSNIHINSQCMPHNAPLNRIIHPSSQIPQQLVDKTLSNNFHMIENVKSSDTNMETDELSEHSIESSFSSSFLKKIPDSHVDDLDQPEYVPLEFLKSQSLKRHEKQNSFACSDMEVKDCSETMTNKLSDSQRDFLDSQRVFSAPHCQEPPKKPHQEPHPEHFHPVSDISPSREDAPQLNQQHLYRHTPPPQHLNLPDFISSQLHGVSERRVGHYMDMNQNSSVSQIVNPTQTFLSEQDMKNGFVPLQSPQYELQESYPDMRTLPQYTNFHRHKVVVSHPGMSHPAPNDLFRPAAFPTYTPNQTVSSENSNGKRAGSTRSDSTISDTTRADSTRSDVTRSDVTRSGSDRDQRYNYIDNNQVTSVKEDDAMKEELSRLEGWCPWAHGQNIIQTMEKYRKKDGWFCVWKSRRQNRYILTVSHMEKLIHLEVLERRDSNSVKMYFLFEHGHRYNSVKSLIDHYRQSGIQTAVKADASKKKYKETIQLLHPVKK